MKVVAIIPAKSKSSRIESKNTKLLCNMPLFIHTLDKLLKISIIDEVWLDTDDINIINIANNYGYNEYCYKNFKYFIRDKKFSDNSTNGNKLLENEISNIESDIYIQVLCTSPFTNIDSIIECINILKNGEYKSVVGYFKEKYYLWKNGKSLYDKYNIPNSNDLEDTIIESMSLYGITKDEFTKYKLRIGNNPYLLELKGEEIIDINYEKDFIFAEKIAFYNKFNEQNVFNNLKIKLNSGMISDILNGVGCENFILKQFKLNMTDNKLFGRVRPIQIRALKENEDPNNIYDCLNSYKNINYGDIIFVNNLIDSKAYFGDLNATIALRNNAQGTIINGYTRDINKTINLKYPTFYKNNTCDDVKNVGTLDFYDELIIIDDINIYVNNLIFADEDGIIIIPKHLEKYVLDKCVAIIENESNISNSITIGIDLNNILNKYGNF